MSEVTSPPHPPQPRGAGLPVGPIVVVACFGIFLLVSLLTHQQDDGSTTKRVGIILAAGLTLTMYSFLFGDNVFFKMAENLYVGVSLGYGLVLSWYQVFKTELYDPLFQAADKAALREALVVRAVPIVLGIMLVTRISRKFAWPSRYSFALVIGWGAGLGIPISVASYVLRQLQAALVPLSFTDVSAAWNAEPFSLMGFAAAFWAPLVGLMVLVATFAVLYYFFFSFERGPAGKVISRIGIIFLMVSFGASFGYTVMARMSLFIDRIDFLLYDWLGIPM